MMLTRFVKMHGCGNDFIIIDDRVGLPSLTPARISELADRHTGIGCDQLIIIGAAMGVDAFIRIFNPDGSEAGACGNATRCVADMLMRESQRETVEIRTASSDLSAIRRGDGLIEVDMGLARLAWDDIPLVRPIDTLWLDLPGAPAAVNMGNPHATLFVDNLDTVAVDVTGPALERDALFPQGANIGFARVLDQATIRLRVWERGAGLTLACGSGACAALVNAHRRGLTQRRARIVMDGGILEIDWRIDGHVLMAGPVATAFVGEVNI